MFGPTCIKPLLVIITSWKIANLPLIQGLGFPQTAYISILLDVSV